MWTPKTFWRSSRSFENLISSSGRHGIWHKLLSSGCSCNLYRHVLHQITQPDVFSQDCWQFARQTICAVLWWLFYWHSGDSPTEWLCIFKDSILLSASHIVYQFKASEVRLNLPRVSGEGVLNKHCLYTPVPRAIMLKAKVERCSGLLRASALRCTLTNKQKQTQRNLTHYHEIHRSNILEIAVTACWHQGRLKNSGFFGNFPHVGEPRSTAWEIQSQ